MSSKTNRFSLRVLQSWGIASARHTSGTIVLPSSTEDTEFLFDVPIGPNIVRWDIAKQQRVTSQQFQVHCDLVTCMRRSPSGYYVATSCYGGGVRLWRGNEWECLATTKAPMASHHHVCVCVCVCHNVYVCLCCILSVRCQGELLSKYLTIN